MIRLRAGNDQRSRAGGRAAASEITAPARRISPIEPALAAG